VASRRSARAGLRLISALPLHPIAIKPAQGDVLYIALEDSQRRLKRRMAKLLPDDGAWPERLTLQTLWRRASDGGLDDIREWCQSVSVPTLVMIDTLEKFRPLPNAGVQNYSADYEAITGLQEITKDSPGLAIVLAHHVRKMDSADPFDTVSGTFGLTGAADTVLIMRGAMPGRFCLTFEVAT
jgi:AAA domain-containing protein